MRANSQRHRNFSGGSSVSLITSSLFVSFMRRRTLTHRGATAPKIALLVTQRVTLSPRLALVFVLFRPDYSCIPETLQAPRPQSSALPPVPANRTHPIRPECL